MFTCDRFATQRLLFLDLETGGLDARSHEILEIGAVLTAPDGVSEFRRLDARVQPRHPDRITEGAAAVNGYSAAGWRTARSLDEVLIELLDLARGATLVGHNIGFDWGFILTALRARGLRWSGNGRYLDTMSLAALVPGGVPNRRLLTMASQLGIPTTGAHCAVVDALMCRSLFLRLAPTVCAPLVGRLPAEVVRRTPAMGRARPSRWRRAAGAAARAMTRFRALTAAGHDG